MQQSKLQYSTTNMQEFSSSGIYPMRLGSYRHTHYAQNYDRREVVTQKTLDQFLAPPNTLSMTVPAPIQGYRRQYKQNQRSCHVPTTSTQHQGTKPSD